MLNRMRLRFLPNFSEIPAETKSPRIRDGWFRLTGMFGFSRKLSVLRDLTQPGDLVEIHQDAGGVLSLQLGQSDGEEGGHGAVSEDWQQSFSKFVAVSLCFLFCLSQLSLSESWLASGLLTNKF